MQEKNERRPNAVRSLEMRERLVAAARALFVEKGFADTGTPEIVKRAEVTRGALYHHFKDKSDLFEAVVRAEADAIEEEINLAAVSSGNASDAMRDGAEGFFRAMTKPGRVRLLLIDGPSVLGFSVMDEIDAGAGRAALRAGLQAMCPGKSEAQIQALSITLSAAFDRAAIAISEGASAAEYTEALISLATGLND